MPRYLHAGFERATICQTRYPDNPIAAGQVDAVIDCMFDIQASIRPSIYETNSQRKVRNSHGLCTA